METNDFGKELNNIKLIFTVKPVAPQLPNAVGNIVNM